MAFVTRKWDMLKHYQVTAFLTEQSTFDRRFTPLKAIPDNYPKTILTLGRF